MGPRKARERTGQPEKLSRLKALVDEIYVDIQAKERGATDKEFLTEHDLEKIWTSERLTPFLECADIPLSEDVFTEARDNFKKILSILVEIGWSAEEWPKFKQHIWEQVGSEGNRSHADANLPFSADLISFLDPRCRKSFLSAQYKFIPICIKEGVHNRHDTKLRLPFVNPKAECIGNGGYGVVTKEVIACRQFLYATDSKNEVRLCTYKLIQIQKTDVVRVCWRLLVSTSSSRGNEAHSKWKIEICRRFGMHSQ
jgi:hypothetical protein